MIAAFQCLNRSLLPLYILLLYVPVNVLLAMFSFNKQAVDVLFSQAQLSHQPQLIAVNISNIRPGFKKVTPIEQMKGAYQLM